MVGHGGSSAGSYLADPTSPIPYHCASIVATSTVRVKTALCRQECVLLGTNVPRASLCITLHTLSPRIVFSNFQRINVQKLMTCLSISSFFHKTTKEQLIVLLDQSWQILACQIWMGENCLVCLKVFIRHVWVDSPRFLVLFFKLLIVRWLSGWDKCLSYMKCAIHNPEVLGSNPVQVVGLLRVRSPSVWRWT